LLSLEPVMVGAYRAAGSTEERRGISTATGCMLNARHLQEHSDIMTVSTNHSLTHSHNQRYCTKPHDTYYTLHSCNTHCCRETRSTDLANISIQELGNTNYNSEVASE
jgi:hypothetical protein